MAKKKYKVLSQIIAEKNYEAGESYECEEADAEILINCGALDSKPVEDEDTAGKGSQPEPTV